MYQKDSLWLYTLMPIDWCVGAQMLRRVLKGHVPLGWLCFGNKIKFLSERVMLVCTLYQASCLISLTNTIWTKCNANYLLLGRCCKYILTVSLCIPIFTKSNKFYLVSAFKPGSTKTGLSKSYGRYQVPYITSGKCI